MSAQSGTPSPPPNRSREWAFRAFVLAFILILTALAAAWIRDTRDASPGISVVDRRQQIGEVLAASRRRGPVPSPGIAGYTGVLPSLPRAPIDYSAAVVLFPVLSRIGVAYDPRLLHRRVANDQRWWEFPEHSAGGFYIRTNALGLRQDAEVRPLTGEGAPDLRILLTGDSHMDGVGENHECTPALLAEKLTRAGRSVEVLNAAAGSYTLYNYLLVLERYVELEPDWLVVVVYGGNDFWEAMKLERYYGGRGAPARARGRMRRIPTEGELGSRVAAQELAQAGYFVDNQADLAAAARVAGAVSEHLLVLARERGVEVLFVYLPPASRGQPQFFAEETLALGALEELDEAAVGVSDRLADGWLAGLAERGARTLDLRGVLRAASEPLYWSSDRHVNFPGHRVVAAEIAGMLEAALSRD